MGENEISPRRRVCGDDVRLDGGVWLTCFMRHIPRARPFPENAEDPKVATSSLPHLAHGPSNRRASFTLQTPIVFLVYTITPDRDGIARECIKSSHYERLPPSRHQSLVPGSNHTAE